MFPINSKSSQARDVFEWRTDKPKRLKATAAECDTTDEQARAQMLDWLEKVCGQMPLGFEVALRYFLKCCTEIAFLGHFVGGGKGMLL